MKKIMLLVLCSGFMSSAFARDSDWKLCVGDAKLFDESVKLVVNVFEHRNGSDARATDLTMIYGGHVLKGAFNSTSSDTSVVVLKNEESSYRGVATVNYPASTIALVGRLTLNGSPTNVRTILKCTTLGN